MYVFDSKYVAEAKEIAAGLEAQRKPRTIGAVLVTGPQVEGPEAYYKLNRVYKKGRVSTGYSERTTWEHVHWELMYRDAMRALTHNPEYTLTFTYLQESEIPEQHKNSVCVTQIPEILSKAPGQQSTSGVS